MMKSTGWIIAGFVGLIGFFLALPGPVGADSATLRWNANTNPDMSGYNVYWGERTRVYGPPMPVGNTTTWRVDGLTPGKTYFFAVTALDTSGNESGFSSEVSKAIAAVEPAPPPPDPATALISGITVASGSACTTAYGLKIGEACYIDSTRKYTHIPTSVQEAAYIVTAHADRRNTSASFLSFTVDRDVTVYVAHDDRLGKKPGWLKQNFKDTGMNVKNATKMSLFARDFPAGQVTLGGNNGSKKANMYTVIVVPR